MVILSDIIMDGCVSGDIIINSLTHYPDIDVSDLSELIMYCKTLPVECKLIALLREQLSMHLQTEMINDIPFSIYMGMSDLDDCKIKLVSTTDIGGQLLIGDEASQEMRLQTTMSDEFEYLIPLHYYDEYLVCHFDKYSMGDMDKKTIL